MNSAPDQQHQPGGVEEGEDQPQHAVHRVAREDHRHRRSDGQRREQIKGEDCDHAGPGAAPIDTAHRRQGWRRSPVPSGRRWRAIWPCRRAIPRGVSVANSRFGPSTMASTGQASCAQPAIDAFDHVDVVAGGAAAAVLARLGLDGDRLRRADRLAQFARDAALLAIGIAAQRMLAAEARALRRLLVRDS